MKRFKIILIVLLIIVISVALFIYNVSKWLDSELSILDNKNIELNNGIVIKDKGLYLLQRSLRKGDLLLIGSSELSAPVEQNPINMYPNSELSVNVNKIGKAHRQSLLDAIMLGSLNTTPEDKIAILVSLQWFEGSDIDKKGFQANFSELQFLSFLKNEQIDNEAKKYVCLRLSELLSGEVTTTESCFWAALNAKDNVLTKIGRGIFFPYYEFKYRMLLLKDKYDAYKFLKETKEKEYVVQKIDWNYAMSEAHEQGQKQCTNNNFFVYDEYYDKYLLGKIEKQLGRDKNKELLNSKELGDYELMLNISQAKNIKPYCVIMSTNGIYYDYIGLDRKKRDTLYEYLKDRSKAHNIPYLELRPYEYEPYFYCDVMHLGWKGWIFVNEHISTYFSNS